jgi:hypothetical protein
MTSNTSYDPERSIYAKSYNTEKSFDPERSHLSFASEASFDPERSTWGGASISSPPSAHASPPTGNPVPPRRNRSMDAEMSIDPEASLLSVLSDGPAIVAAPGTHFTPFTCFTST